MSNKPKITPTQDGPYQLEDTSIIKSYAGKEHVLTEKTFLCRCGGSKNKPFCDGTHTKNGFKGDKDPDRVPDKRDNYKGTEITIHDNRGLCAHSGRCTDSLKKVFKLNEEPWIDPDAETKEKIIETIKTCPSGALSYSLSEVEYRERGGETGIVYAPNGPYVCSGVIELKDTSLPEGATLDHLTLCRCGKSSNKPFCSGAHWNHQFDEDAKK